MSFKTNHDVGYAGRIHPPETPISFKAGDEAIRDRLLELEAIRKAGTAPATKVPPAPKAPAKPKAEAPKTAKPAPAETETKPEPAKS